MPSGLSPRSTRPDEFIMFPPPNREITMRRRSHSKKKPANHIPRPPNAFILFRSSFIKSQHVSTAVETNHSTLSTIIGLTWSNMPEEQRQVWHRKAKEALADHKRKFPKYVFRPVQAKASVGVAEQRKVREVQPKDTKRCAKIAELLVEGKTGNELDVAVQEFDKTHVPQVVTRFEPPITAHSFRPSSPIARTETSSPHGGQCLVPSPASARSSSVHCSPSTPTTMDHVVVATQEIHSPVPTHSFELDSFFDLADFSFDDAAGAIPALDCNPLLLQTTTGAMADDTFGTACLSDTLFSEFWPASLPQLTEIPSYMHIPLSDGSLSGFPCLYGDFPVLSNPQVHFPFPQQEAVHGGYSHDTLYAAFNDFRLGDDEFSHLDLDFTTFMTALDRYY